MNIWGEAGSKLYYKMRPLTEGNVEVESNMHPGVLQGLLPPPTFWHRC